MSQIKTKFIAAGAVTASKLGTVTDGITLDQSGTGSTLEVKSGGISNTQISGSAAIAFSKLAALTSANFLVGNGSNVATSVPMSGDISLSNTGSTSIVATSNSSLTTLSGLTTASALVTVGTVTSGTWNATTIAIAHGGTGQTTKAAAFDALSPNSTKGDIITYSTTNVNHGVPNDYGFLVPDSTQTDGWRNAPYTAMEGRPGKNYIQYADFENNSTTGWTLGTIGTLTNGLPTGSPTFGSGASGNLSIAATSSSIEGTYSLNYVSSAATTAGNMVASSSYAIDAEDQAKVLTVKFYYKAASGASNCNFSGTSSNSFAWAVYDVTNSAWLTSAGNFNLVQSSGCGYVTGTCQTNATTANIRLCVYNANATSGAATLTIDGFYVGPQTAPSGPVMGDWQTYTLTIGGSSSAPTINGGATSTAYYRRVGDSVEIRYFLSQGSAGSSGSGTYLFPLPSGMTIDSTKVTLGTQTIGDGQNCVGTCQVANTTSADTNSAVQGLMYAYNTSNLYMVITSTNAIHQLGIVGSTSFALGGGAQYYSFEAMVPISGWSSNSSMSADTDTRVVAAKYTGNGGQSITSSSDIPFATSSYDTHAAWNGTQYKTPVSGIYQIAGLFRTSGTSSLNTFVYVNGVQGVRLESDLSATLTHFFPTTSVMLNAGDLLSVRQDASVTLSNSATDNWIAINRLSGPAVVTATESVNCSYGLTTGYTPTGNTAVLYDTKIYDSHNAFSTGTGGYTVPVSGKYRMSGVGSCTTGTNDWYIVKNSTAQGWLFTAGFGSTEFGSGSMTISCNAGDVLYFYQDSAHTFQGFNSTSNPAGVAKGYSIWMSIERVGN